MKDSKYYSDFEAVKFIKKRDKVCIIGFAPSWNETPWGQEDMDFWGINELYMQAVNKRFDAWFEVHDIKNSPSKQNPKHQDFLKNCKLPLLTRQHWDDYPTSIKFPWEYLMDYYNQQFIIDDKGGKFEDYSNQISWMISLAIALEYKEIHIYGVDMAQASEYMHQRASCQFFIGYAVGHGILVKVPASCELLKGGAPYGFESDNANRHRKKSRIKSVQQQIQTIILRQKDIDYWIEEELTKGLEKDMIIASEKLNVLNNQIIHGELNKLPVHHLYEEKKNIEIYIQNKKKDVFVNIKILEDENKRLQINKENLEGVIKECQHDLNNNLV